MSSLPGSFFLTNKGRAFARDKVLYMHMHGTDDEAIQNLRVPLEI